MARTVSIYSMTEMIGLRNNPDRWIVKDMVPFPGRTVVHGHGGDYKTTVFNDLGIAVASGGKLMEQFPIIRHGPVLIFSTEGDIYANKDRFEMHLRAKNLHPSAVNLHYGQDALFLDDKEDRRYFEAALKQIKPVMVVLDPFVSFFSGDENNVSDVKKFLHGLDPMIKEHRFALVVIHHSRKDGDVRGSTALRGWTDSMIRFDVTEGVELPGVPMPVDVLDARCTKQRNGKKGRLFTAVPFIDEELKTVSFGIYDEVEAKNVGDLYLRQEVFKFLRREEGALTKSQIREHFNVSQKRIDMALEYLNALDLVALVKDKRPTSSNGDRERSVDAWRAVPKRSVVDAMKAILEKARRLPSKAYALDERDPSGVCYPGIAKG